MIATLSGKILIKGINKAVIEVGGVGYEVFLTADTLARLPDIGEDAFLYIHTHVREDAIVLYGFFEEEEKEMYLILTTVSGVGPKLSLSILSGMQVAHLCRAIIAKDIAQLTRLPGVGKKTAERICLDLKEKVGHLAAGSGRETVAADSSDFSITSTTSDTLSALINLGYPEPICRRALSKIRKQLGEQVFSELQVADMIRECLRTLA